MSQFYYELPASIDSRNKLNDLTCIEWHTETTSFIYHKGLGSNHAYLQIKKLNTVLFRFRIWSD